MQLLEVPYQAYGTTEELSSNIRSALVRGLPELPPALCTHDGTFVIVGSGPSMPACLTEIKEERSKGRPICAINGAHDFLCGVEVKPELFLSVDPRTTIIENTRNKNRYTTYLIASRCHPGLFDHLKDCKVMLWHSWCEEPEAKEFKGHMGIGGGTTSGTRAIYVGYVMGFRRFVIFGLDSSLAEDGETKRFSGEKAGKIIDVRVGEKTFLTNVPMAQQANEIQNIMQALPDVTIDFRGSGLIPAIWEERKRLGLPV